MKNIIIVGDSFCSAPGWPTLLAGKLNLNLIQHGAPGQPWWDTRKFLTELPKSELDNTEIIIFAHTNADRIPSSNLKINTVDHSNLNSKNELELAVKLYFKYIHEYSFFSWAIKKWYEEINTIWARKKTIHLHSFRTLPEHQNILNGAQILPDLCSISLNELGIDKFRLFDDNRKNHFNYENNNELANQLYEAVLYYNTGYINLNVDKFQLKTDIWFKKETWDAL